MEYRREIDGLRAVAVLPVMLFHAGFAWLSGGFLGVDVFFVISGYLITTILVSELESGSFSIVGFYERRARRILPALFVVAAVCAPFSAAWLFPGELREFSESLIAVALFCSNILFWRQTDYFDSESELKPLLHTWSLAVEEQFYLLFPLLLMLAWRMGIRRRRLAMLIALAACVSLGVAQWGAIHKPDANFFLLPSRAWELALGALAALHLYKREQPELSAVTRQALSLLGFGMLAFSMLTYSRSTPHPSAYTLIPVVGALLLVLYARPDTYVGRLLGSKALVGVGLISYSAYLWHQPLFSLVRSRAAGEPDPLVFVGLSALTLGLAYTSWRFVERPFRDRHSFDRRSVFTLAAAGSVLTLAVGLYGELSKGHVYRSSFEVASAAVEQRLRVNRGLSMLCEKEFNPSAECRTADDPELILWGDSFAMHLVPGLLASNPELKMVQATKSVCGPVFDAAPVNYKYTQAWARECLASNQKVLDYIRATKSLKYAVLSSPFGQYVNDDWQLLTRAGRLVSSREHGLELFKDTLRRLRELGVTPIVFSPPPQDGRNIGKCLGKAILFDQDPSVCNVPAEAARAHQKDVMAFLTQVQREADVVWLNDALCHAGTCSSTIDETFVYRDKGHLSHEGSALLGQRMDFSRLILSAR